MGSPQKTGQLLQDAPGYFDLLGHVFRWKKGERNNKTNEVRVAGHLPTPPTGQAAMYFADEEP